MSCSRLTGFNAYPTRAEAERLLAEVCYRDDMNGDVARNRSALELVENLQAGTVGEIHVENNGLHLESLGRGKAVGRRLGGDAQKSQLAGEVAENPGEAQIVLDDENDPRVGRNLSAIVLQERWLDLGRLRGQA